MNPSGVSRGRAHTTQEMLQVQSPADQSCRLTVMFLHPCGLKNTIKHKRVWIVEITLQHWNNHSEGIFRISSRSSEADVTETNCISEDWSPAVSVWGSQKLLFVLSSYQRRTATGFGASTLSLLRLCHSFQSFSLYSFTHRCYLFSIIIKTVVKSKKKN